MKMTLLLFMIGLFVVGPSYSYEGPIKNTYAVGGSIRLVSCDAETAPASSLGDWYFGPADSSGKCLVNNGQSCNIPFGFVLFDKGKPYGHQADPHEENLCAVASSWNSCAYIAVSIQSLSDGSDVIHVKTAITSNDQQRVTSENDYPIDRFLNQKRSFVGTANGCQRFELELNVHPAN